MTRGLWLHILAMLWCSTAMANDALLIQEEVEDAESREQAELEDRIRDLEAQHEASKSLAEKQQRLIEALQAQIERLEEDANARQD